MINNRPHSLEFRQLVINYFHQTNNKTKTCQNFKISIQTLNRWLDPEYHKKCRNKHKHDYYHKPGYKEKHNKTITKNILHKMKDSNYRKQHNEYFKVWAKDKYDNDPIYKERLLNNTKQYLKKKYQINPEYNLKERLRAQLRGRLKSKNITNRIDSFIGCSIKQLKHHIENQFQTGMTWENYNEWHIDHIIPCSKFNLLNEDEQKKCFHYSNLQPLWAADNIHKSNK